MTEKQIIAELLKARGIKDPKKFIAADYKTSLHDSLQLPDMAAAVKRLIKAQKADEKVAIYGDYDVDGLTATALLLDVFDKFTIEATHFIPDRYTDGYGLSHRGVDELANQDVKLIITVDTGSLAHEQIDYASSKGIDVIVTDHHTPKGELPECVAVINPKREDSSYPFTDLAGVGVAFKLAQALATKLDGLPAGQEKWLLDLVALGTVCDVVDLLDENRALVKWGIEVMKQTKRPGLIELMKVANVEPGKVDARSFGFRMGPRLNAAGRIETAHKALEILTAQSKSKAKELASELDQLNSQRRDEQRQILEEAMLEVEKYADNSVLVVSNPGWSHGIAGIVASKLAEELAKPTFVLQEEGKLAKGSARSFGDFHLAKALEKLEEQIEKGGGHAYAAGVTVKLDQLNEFRTAINDYYQSLKLKNQDKYLVRKADLELEDFASLTTELAEQLAELAPFGQGHEVPLFKVRAKVNSWRAVGNEGVHAKVTLEDKNGQLLDGIGFGLSELMPEAGQSIKAVFSLELNTWNGNTKVQAVLSGV